MQNPPRLELLCEYEATVKDPVLVGPGPVGLRQVFDITGGVVTGPRLRGRILPSGADWMLTGPDNVARLDVRGTMETDDGAFVFLQYTGFIHMGEAVMRALSEGRMTEFGEAYFYTTPRFETGDPRYAWLNTRVFLGQGRLGPGRVAYRCFEVG